MQNITSHHFKMQLLMNSTGANLTLFHFRKIHPEHNLNGIVIAVILLIELMIAFGIIVNHRRRLVRNR